MDAYTLIEINRETGDRVLCQVDGPIPALGEFVTLEGAEEFFSVVRVMHYVREPKANDGGDWYSDVCVLVIRAQNAKEALGDG
jgi:hypothetical protein